MPTSSLVMPDLRGRAKSPPSSGLAPTPETEERLLVQRAKRGEPGAFGRLYERHVQTVLRYIRFRVQDESLALDLTQDVFIAALRGLHGLRQDDRFRHWLMRIAHNHVVTHWQRRGRQPDSESIDTLDDEDVPTSGALRRALVFDPREGQERRMRVEEVLAATSQLTEMQHQVLSLRFVAGLSLAETAEIVGRSVDATKKLQRRALVTVKNRLAAREDSP